MGYWRNQKGNQKILEKTTMKTQLKTYEMQQNSTKSEVYSNKILPHETRKTSNRQLNFILKATRKRRKKIAKGKKS